MKRFLLVLGLSVLISGLNAQSVIVGWHAFPNQTTALNDHPADYSATGIVGVLIGAKKYEAVNGDGKYGDQFTIDPAPTVEGGSYILNTYNASNKKLVIKVSNNTGADLTLNSLHFDCKLNFGVSGVIYKVNHNNADSQLTDDAQWGAPLANTTLAADDYTWKHIDIPFAGTDMTDLTLADGEYATFRVQLTAVGTDAGGINIDNIAITDNSTPTAIGSALTDKVKVYPNPATDVINISAADADVFEVVLMDVTGKVVYQGKTAKQINVSMLPKGLYVLKIETTNGETCTSKIMIK